MNYETHDADFEQPMFTQHDDLAVLEEQLYGHVRTAIDFDALSRLEQMLCLLLADTHAMSTELAIDVAAAVMHRALLRAAGDSARYINSGAPLGITDAEKAAVAFEEECPFCIAQRNRPPARDVEEDEPCPCCDDIARMWREQHHDTLVKAGLAKAKTSS